MGHRWRSKRKAGSEEEDDAVIVLSSSDDEEANEDLSLEIVERARRRNAKRKRSEDDSVGAVQAPVVDLSSTSSDEVEAAPDQRSAAGDGSPESLVEGEEKKKKRKKMKKKMKKVEENGALDSPVKEEEQFGTPDSVVTAVNEASNNVVLQKLLRGPRYFDPGDRITATCYNCGEEGHMAVQCMMEKRQKPCFVCGMFGHKAKQCTQGQDCFICKRRGHHAKECPDKHKQVPQDSKFCLQCGDIGHDMSSCNNNYVPHDLKEIQCYICKVYGHLCCADITFDAPKDVSCYNCAQIGHTGLGCAKQRGETSFVATPTLCYKCGGEGHFARGCTQTTKPSRWKGEPSTPNHRFQKKRRDSMGFRSVPHDFGKTHKGKHMQYEERRNTTAGKSQIKGGWVVDDPGDLPKIKPRGNGWASPSMPVRNSHKGHRPSSSSRSPHKKHNSFVGTPSQHAYGAYRSSHGYSASRFGNSQDRSWRT